MTYSQGNPVIENFADYTYKYRDKILVGVICGVFVLFQPYSGLYSDLWSSAVILFALLSGRLPYQEGDSGAVVRQIKAPLAFPSYLSLGE